MKIIETIVYQFDELSQEAQSKALMNLHDINVRENWWDAVYEDAKNIGVKIKAFDLGRGAEISLEFTESLVTVAVEIANQRGDESPLVPESLKFIEVIHTGHNDEDLEEAFKNEIEQDYLTMLQNEYEYLLSDEAVKGTIEANEYWFTEDGEWN